MRQAAEVVSGTGADEGIVHLRLTHGRAVWVLAELGFSEGIATDTFNHYIKSLRKLGIPFVRGEAGLGAKRTAHYSFGHMMELALALRLRVYGILPDPVVAGIVQFRQELGALYRRAYLEAKSGLGAPVLVRGPHHDGLRMSGVYLDLHIRYVRGKILQFGPPQVLSPFEAVRRFASAQQCGSPHMPFNLSSLALDLVETAERAPNIRRGPR